MKGTILDYSGAMGNGVVLSDNGTRHKFLKSDFKSDGTPKIGDKVDFIANEAGDASEIYSVSSQIRNEVSVSSAMKKSIIAIVCSVIAFFVPLMGVVLSIGGLIIGRQARAAAKDEGDNTAGTVALVAIIISSISVIFAIFTAFLLIAVGGSLFM